MSGFIADTILMLRQSGPEHQDAALHQAWADYVAACHAYGAGDDTPENEEVFTAAINEAEERLLAAPVSTIEGIALRLRWHVGDEVKTETQAVAVRNGELIPPEEFDDPRAQSIARLLRDVERMVAAGMIGAAGNH